jgi:hypothetical protein
MRTPFPVGAAGLMAMILLLGSCGGNEGGSDTGNSLSPWVPEGAVKTHQAVINRYAPPGYLAVSGWAQIATLTKDQAGEPASVDVDYMKLIEEDPTAGTTVLYEENYGTENPGGLTLDNGAMFDRSPTWFGNDEHRVAMTTSSIHDGVLTIDVSSAPDNIAHWWTERKACKPTATYFLEMRVKITGKVGLQFGGNFWVDVATPWTGQPGEKVSYFASDWYGDTGGEYIVIRGPVF